MTAASSVHSNASNFMSAMQNGVDIRTGLYKITIKTPEIPTNDLRGPNFGLGLSYSALNTSDIGYGRGWDVQLSQYDPGSQILSLSTGETFMVTGANSSTGQYVMSEKKLASFHFYQPDENGHYRVVHKSGLVEILKMQGGSTKRLALPIEIYSPVGHKITLGYVPFSSSHYILSWIKDSSDETLLKVVRKGSSIEMLLHPFAEGGPLARFVMTLQGSTNYVSQITLPTEEKASWHFGYSLKGEHLCISSVTTPAGGREEILYQDMGHQFPGTTGLAPLPRVTGHRIYPGAGQPKIDVEYTYPGGNNFVGFGLPITWDNLGLDNLYKYNNAYDYFCVETLRITDAPTEEVPHPKPRPVRTIERKYNRFHLLTSETTTQNNNVHKVETTYYLNADPTTPFAQQSAYCQLPKEIKTTWSLRDNAAHRRSETVSSTYDHQGNLLTKTELNGVVETSTWYPASDAHDFVRLIKDRTVTPAASDNGKAPTLCTRYIYKAMPPLPGSPLADWHTPESETLVQVDGDGETELQRTEFKTYGEKEEEEEEVGPFLYGRVKQKKVTLQGKCSFIDYAYEIGDHLGVPVQQIKETLSTDIDQATKTITRQRSLLSSLELLSVVDGVKTQYTYDSLNRLTEEVVSPGLPQQARRQYQYTLSPGMGLPIDHVIIDAQNVLTRIVLDGFGRAVFEERDHVDEEFPSQSRQTRAALFDAWGNLAEETAYDWEDGKELSLKSHFIYDDWAQQSTVIGPDGVEEHQVIDPIGTTDSDGPITRSWTQSAGPNPIITGMSETWLNRFQKPALTRVMNAAGEEVSVQTYKYDGLGRCTEQTDRYKRITQYTYDVWSRMVSTTLPDASIVKREYAAHSTSELPVALRVSGDGANYTLVGEQEFDGLERLTRVTTGTRTERFAYKDGQMQVSSKTKADGKCITYDYNLDLTDQPIRSQAPDEIAGFTYDSTSAHLTHAQNELGTREYTYNAVNQIIGERWTDKHEKVWTALHANSMQGRVLKRTDLIQEGDDGLDTVYGYDDVARLISVNQDQLKAEFEYNKLGQLSRTTTTDTAANSVLVTELEYDDWGREIKRTLMLDEQLPRIQEQTWLLDGQLENRHLQQGAISLLKETFGYDVRGRLISHECSGSTLPRDAEGRSITKQIFTFDALDNIKVTLTTFAKKLPEDPAITERALFSYAPDDPCLLEKITYTPPRMAADPTFAYDANGNQLNDERGQLLSYDSQNRLLKVAAAGGQVVNTYSYDSHDHLVNTTQGDQSETLRFYQGEQLNAVVQDDRKTRILYHTGQPLGQQQADDPTQTLLLMTDANNSVIGESQQSNLRTAVYSAYGERHSDDTLHSLLAFTGEVLDQASGWYLLGRGYRAYNPIMMRFHSPDSLSPFGSGGVNPYTYCLGNPIAFRDPTGHEAIGWSGRLRRPDEDRVTPLTVGTNWLPWVLLAVSAVFTAGAAVAAYKAGRMAVELYIKVGFGLAVTGAVLLGTGAALGTASTAAQAVAAATGDEDAWMWSMYLGLASAVPSFAGGLIYAKGLAQAAQAAKLLEPAVKQVNETLKVTMISNRFIVQPRVLGSAGYAAAQASAPLLTAPRAANPPGINPDMLANQAARPKPVPPAAPAQAPMLDQLAVEVKNFDGNVRHAVHESRLINQSKMTRGSAAAAADA